MQLESEDGWKAGDRLVLGKGTHQCEVVGDNL
jgi:hypothetical protein